MNGIDIVRYLETKYPKQLAYDWDNVGLQVGTLNKPVKKVLVTLDVTPDVVREAIALKADFLISHHPLIFKPVYNVLVESPRGWMIQKLLAHGIPLYSMHTNYDLSEGGMNDVLAAKLGIREPKLLDETEKIGRYGQIAPTLLDDYIRFVKDALQADHVRLIGGTSKPIEVVGVSGGSGSNHINEARRRGCDLYITGDVTYHSALDAVQMGQIVLDVGHYAEQVFKAAIAEELRREFPDLTVVTSQIDTNPYETR
jgi:GTP cyclohydrolase I